MILGACFVCDGSVYYYVSLPTDCSQVNASVELTKFWLEQSISSLKFPTFYC